MAYKLLKDKKLRKNPLLNFVYLSCFFKNKINLNLCIHVWAGINVSDYSINFWVMHFHVETSNCIYAEIQKVNRNIIVSGNCVISIFT